jgi:hypothetical protein
VVCVRDEAGVWPDDPDELTLRIVLDPYGDDDETESVRGTWKPVTDGCPVCGKGGCEPPEDEDEDEDEGEDEDGTDDDDEDEDDDQGGDDDGGAGEGRAPDPPNRCHTYFSTN